ncbi:unnamed protein product, partial [Prorocentrum cordatum]
VPHEADIHRCSFDVPSLPDESGERVWSDWVDRIQASFRVNAKPCVCQGRRRRHKSDWRSSSDSDQRKQQRDEQHLQYMVAMLREINDALVIEGNRSPPESRTKEAMIVDIHQEGSSNPTEARMRAKMKALVDKPKEAKRKKFEIENHFDDCGDSITGLGMSSELFAIYKATMELRGAKALESVGISMFNARDSWMESYERCQPLAILCGEVALYQLDRGRGFINESPAGSKLYHEPPWRRVAVYPGVVYAMVDHCKAGLRSSTGVPMRKRTEQLASHEALLRHAAMFQCDGGHELETIEGREETERARTWPWSFAVSIANGIMDYSASPRTRASSTEADDAQSEQRPTTQLQELEYHYLTEMWTLKTYQMEEEQAMDGDWARWDLGSARRALFRNNEAMKRMLTAAGVPPKVIQVVEDIVDTCGVCRLCMNGCIRFTVARELVDKSLEYLLNFIWTAWIQMFGPMAVLTVDGEGAMASKEAGMALGKIGTTRKLKAPGQHAQVAERHHKILRRQLHLIDAQCRENDIKTSFARKLAEAAYANNAFQMIGDGTPSKALYGRVPRGLAISRHAQRLREIATTSIIEATAQARMERAAKSRAAPVLEALKLEIGDLVHFFNRGKAPKEVPNWKGPAKVVSAAAPETGTLTIQWQGRIMAIKATDV